jgi:hypothetical protein
MAPTAYVHLLSADRDAILDVLDSAEAQFLAFGVAPDVRRPRALSVADARTHAERTPTAPDETWLPYLSPELVAAAADGEEARLFHAGIAGMTVVDRIVRETTDGDPDAHLQSDDRPAGILTGYRVYRYEPAAEEYVQTHEVDGLGG